MVSYFNHHFHMAYCKLGMPYTISIEGTIQIYLNSMDHLTAIFLRILPAIAEVITFTKQANPNGGGLMLPPQAITTMPTYPVKASMMPS